MNCPWPIWVLLAVGSATILIAFSCIQRLLGLAFDIFHHHHAIHLTRFTLGGIITALHNGEDLKPYTLDHMIQVAIRRLTDVLLGNDYDIKHWNPKPLIYAVLGESRMLYDFTRAIKRRQELNLCPDSTTTPPTDHTPPSGYTEN